MAHLVDIFLQPGKAFAELRERPTFALPLLLLVVFSAALPLWYFLTVDPGWYVQHMMLASGRDISAADMAKMQAMMPGAHKMAYIGAASAAVIVVVMSCIYALYFMLAGKVTGAQMTFRRGLGLACWSDMPALLGIVVTLVGIATMTPQTGLESLMLTNVDPLLVHLPTDSPWLGLARGFSLLNLWTWFLLALGWRTFNRAGWVQSTVVALIPSALIYGVMALIAFMK
jgi:Yip1-like protein